MKSRIIEIVELGQPKSLIQRKNEPITELIDTNFLIEELNQVLSLCAVSRRSEQLDENEKLCRMNQNFVCNCVDNSICPNF